MDARSPVIVGVGQVTNRRERLVDAMELMEDAARLAATDSGAGAKLLERIDSTQVVNLMSQRYVDPAGSLAGRLGIPDGHRQYTVIGGNTPQLLMGRACDAIASGEFDAVLIVGAEAMDSAKRAQSEGVELGRPEELGTTAVEMIGDGRNGLNATEMAARLYMPIDVYPLFESALANRAGRSPAEQRVWLGRLMAPFTERAAVYPETAWFPAARTPEELSTVTEQNRYVGEPYTKLLNSIIQVDQGAAIIVTSVGTAEAVGVPRDRWVFPWSAAECNDVFYPSERPDLSRSPGIAAAGQRALGAAGVGIDDIATFDFYSCFPSAVQVGAEALGVDPFDARGLTVTGGLPYFGGPGNNYVSHSIATTVDLCRESLGAIGLVTALGWYITKHAVGLYSSEPPKNGWRHGDCTQDQARIDAMAVEVVGPEAEGTATVEAMTVLHDRTGSAVAAPIMARLKDGRRVVASLADSANPAELSETSLIGRKVQIAPASGAPVYDPL